MIDAGQQCAEHLAVVAHPADGRAAKADAVIAAFAADQPATAALAGDLVVGYRHLERGIGGFRSRVAEENMIEALGRKIGDAAGELEGLRNAELEWRRIIQRRSLPADGFGDLGAAVARIAAPHAGGAVEYFTAIGGEVMHVLGAGEQPRRLLEGAVGGKRHPVRGKVVGNVDGGGVRALVQHGGPLRVFGGSLPDTLAVSVRYWNARSRTFSVWPGSV